MYALVEGAHRHVGPRLTSHRLTCTLMVSLSFTVCVACILAGAQRITQETTKQLLPDPVYTRHTKRNRRKSICVRQQESDNFPALNLRPNICHQLPIRCCPTIRASIATLPTNTHPRPNKVVFLDHLAPRIDLSYDAQPTYLRCVAGSWVTRGVSLEVAGKPFVEAPRSSSSCLLAWVL